MVVLGDSALAHRPPGERQTGSECLSHCHEL
ncbi:hypothetical protein LINGRAHAP2_LOCUS3418 [Linum grandiflorum]